MAKFTRQDALNYHADYRPHSARTGQAGAYPATGKFGPGDPGHDRHRRRRRTAKWLRGYAFRVTRYGIFHLRNA